MPFNELQRRDSWPPTIVRLQKDDSPVSDAIDENPISFFLTNPEDMDDFLDDEDLSAGIETPDSDRSPVREVSPSSLERQRQRPLLSDDDDDEDYNFGLAVPMTLKDFTTRHTSGRISRTALERPEDKSKPRGLGIANIPDLTNNRGRPKVRLVPARAMRGRGQTRSLSARRPQSWREPSPEIFPIIEEEEDERKGVVIPEIVVSCSAPASTQIGIGAMRIAGAGENGGRKKLKKRVHWAL